MHPVERSGSRVIQKDIDAGDVTIDKARIFQSRPNPVKFRPVHHDIDVTRVPDRALVNAGDPSRNRVAPDNGIVDAGPLQGFRRKQ